MKALMCAILALLFVTPIAMAKNKLSLQELMNNLKSQDPKTRASAAQELGDRGEKPALEALVAATGDPDQKVELAAVNAVAKVEDPSSVTAKSQAVKNATGGAEREAIFHLTETYIPKEKRGILRSFFVSIGNFFNPPESITIDPWVKVDPQAIDALIYVLDDQKSENRIQAAATLGILLADKALPRLVFYLKSPNDEMVRTCVQSIRQIGNPEAGADLVPLLKHSDKKVVMDSARVLGIFRYKPAIPALTEFLDYSNKDEYKEVALQALDRIGDPSSEAIMRKYLDSKNKNLRQYAIEGLGRMGAKNYVETFERDFQREQSRQIKLALSFSLYSLGRTAFLDTLVRSIDDNLYKNQVRDYFMELGAKAVPDLAAYLKPADSSFRIRVIRMLQDMRQPTAISYLEPYVKDSDIKVAQAATDAINDLKKVQSIT
jgi:HEAT repeat protein